MAKQEPEYLLLKSVSDRIFYSSQKFVLFNNTSLSKNPDIGLPRQVHYFWVEILAYHAEAGKLICKYVRDCVTTPSPYPSDIIEKKQSKYDIQYLDFGSLGQAEPKPQDSRSGPVAALDRNAGIASRPLNHQPGALSPASLLVTAENPPIFIKGTYVVPVEELIFRTGYVIWEKVLPEVGEMVAVWVKNEYVSKELEDLKPLLVKLLKTSTVKLIVAGKKAQRKEDGKISAWARCQELDCIDATFMTQIRYEDALTASAKVKFGVFRREDVTLTARQILTRLLDGPVPTNAQVNAFLEGVFRQAPHAKQLLYLSEKHCEQIMDLRVIVNVKGKRSFLFLIKGASRYHFVWETYNTSNAIYIWHMPSMDSRPAAEQKNLIKKKYLEVESALNMMRNGGRREYHTSRPDDFSRVSHKTDSAGAFEDWLEKFLIAID